MITKGKWLTRNDLLNDLLRKGSSLTSRLFHTEQKVNVEVKPRGRMFGRLGTAESGMEGLDIVLSEQYETNSVQVLE